MLIKECQFCGNTGAHPAAHIFPKSLLGVGPVAFKVYRMAGREPARRSQTGVYDRQLWCNDCELASAKLESYVAPYLQSLDNYKVPWRDPQGHPIEENGRALLWSVREIDAGILHRFVLSLLWRASASQREEVRGFSLGPYQARLREALRSSDANLLEPFPYIFRHEDETNLRAGYVTPFRSRYEGVRFVTLCAGGFAFDVKMSKSPVPEFCRSLVCRSEGPVLVLRHSIAETGVGRLMARRFQTGR